jgi:hypothetical protein
MSWGGWGRRRGGEAAARGRHGAGARMSRGRRSGAAVVRVAATALLPPELAHAVADGSALHATQHAALQLWALADAAVADAVQQVSNPPSAAGGSQAEVGSYKTRGLGSHFTAWCW